MEQELLLKNVRRGSRVAKICGLCGNEFIVKKSHEHKKTYCSKSCLTEHRNGLKLKNIKICKVCKNTFLPGQGSHASKCCSKKCGYISQSKLKVKEGRIVNCARCKLDFRVMPSLINAKYCSRACKDGLKSNMKCQICNCNFTVVKSRKLAKFCSVKCMKKSGVFKSRPREKYSIKDCVQCGKKFGSWDSLKSKFCSRNCVHKFIDKGVGSARDRDMASKEYRAFRRAVMERDGNKCVECGVGKIKVGWLEVHHIHSYRDHVDKRHDVDNGMTLCIPCHANVDKYRNKSIKYEYRAVIV